MRACISYALLPLFQPLLAAYTSIVFSSCFHPYIFLTHTYALWDNFFSADSAASNFLFFCFVGQRFFVYGDKWDFERKFTLGKPLAAWVDWIEKFEISIRSPSILLSWLFERFCIYLNFWNKKRIDNQNKKCMQTKEQIGRFSVFILRKVKPE